MATVMSPIVPAPPILSLRGEEGLIVNSKTALATAAGTNSSHKHRPTSLKTPLSGSYPSALHSPLTSLMGFPTPITSTHLRPGDNTLAVPSPAGSFNSGGKTPLTPPTAYLDFLKAVSPSIMPTPMSANTINHFVLTPSITSPDLQQLRAPLSANLAGRWTGRDKWPTSYAGSSRPQITKPSQLSAPPQRPTLSTRVSAASTVSSMSASSETSNSSNESFESVSSAATAPQSTTLPATETASCTQTPTTPARTVSDSQIPTTISTTGPRTKPTLMRRPSGLIRRPSIIIPPSPSKLPVLLSSISDNPISSFPPSAPALSARDQPVWATRGTPITATTPSGANGSASSPTRTVRVRHVITRTVTRTRPVSGNVTSPETRIPAQLEALTVKSATTQQSPSVHVVMELPGNKITDHDTENKDTSLAVLKAEEFSPTCETSHILDQADVPQRQVAMWAPERGRERSQTPLVGDAPKGKRRKLG